MDSMSRERRPFYALEVDDDEEAYGRLLKARRDSRLQSGRAAETSTSSLWFLPAISCLCGQDGLRTAFEDLEERFLALEDRYNINFLPSLAPYHRAVTYMQSPAPYGQPVISMCKHSFLLSEHFCILFCTGQS